MRGVAIIAGSNTNALGVVRSLGQGHVPTFVMDTKGSQPAMHSRYARQLVVKSIDGEGLIDELLRLARQLAEPAVLFLTSDAQVETVSEHRRLLEGAFVVRMPPHQTVCELSHKATFQQIAERHAFAVPRSIVVRTERDLLALQTLRLPVVIKPGLQRYIFERHMARNYKVRGFEEMHARCREMLAAVEDLIVQEWVEGADSDIYFCLQYRTASGQTLRSFTGRKLRSWPPQLGSTASCMPAPEVAAELEALTTDFFDRVQFVGMGSMEFKRDCRTGEFFMIEPTIGRTDWQEEVATLNGVNIPLAAFCHELALPLPPLAQPSTPIVWRDSLYYWRSVIATGLARERSAGAPKTHPKGVFWRSDDPFPSVYFLLRWLRKIPSPTVWRALRAHST